MLGGDSRFATAEAGATTAFIEIEENLFHAEPVT
jgi:hypothetical protein